MIHLHAGPVINTLPPIVDPDPLLSCDLMDGRDAFLTLARDKHWEFSSLRRSKWSTLCMLVELHTQGQDRFVYTCNECKHHVETRWHCTVCEVGVYHQRLLLLFALQPSLIFWFFNFFCCPEFLQLKPILIKGLLSLKERWLPQWGISSFRISAFTISQHGNASTLERLLLHLLFHYGSSA